MIVLVFGCVSVTDRSKPPIYSIEYKDPNHVRFSGRGAGAGMMMSGSMGPMGIAIGFAIDEGIAKEIRETAASAGISFDGLFREHIQASTAVPVQWLDDSDNKDADTIYRIEKYGFVLVRGSSEEVYPNIVVTQIDANGDRQVITMPDDFLDAGKGLNDALLPRADFNEIKTNADEVERLWRKGLALLNLSL